MPAEPCSEQEQATLQGADAGAAAALMSGVAAAGREEIWQLLAQLPVELQRHILVLADVLHITTTDQGTAPVRLAAARHRQACLLSRAHRRAALAMPPSVWLDWAAEPHQSAAYDPREALAWASKVGATLAGVDAPLCGISFLLASAGMVRQLRVLTLASLRGGYPNAFEASQLPELPCLEVLRLLHYSRMELAGLPSSVRHVSLVPAGNPLRQLGLRYKVHCTGRLLAPLGSLPAHRLRSLRIDSGAVGDGGAPYCNPNLVLLLDVGRLCSCAASIRVAGNSLSLVVPEERQRTSWQEQANWFWTSTAMASTFLANGAERLLLQPAGSCTTPIISGSTGQPKDSLLVAAAARAYVEAAEQVAAAEHPMQWGQDGPYERVRQYSTAPQPAAVAAARRDASSCPGATLETQRGNLLDCLPAAVAGAFREQVVLYEPGQMWLPAVTVSGVHMVRRHAATPDELASEQRSLS